MTIGCLTLARAEGSSLHAPALRLLDPDIIRFVEALSVAFQVVRFL
jgi:hypothetical protein